MAYLWVKDRDIAQDLLQTVFEKALKQDEKLRELKNPIGWIVRTLKNESLQYHRLERRFEPLGERELPGEIDDMDETREDVKHVFQFLRSLPEKQQEVFHLREVEGLTYEEISNYLEIPLDQVKVSLHRARKSLREHLTKKRS